MIDPRDPNLGIPKDSLGQAPSAESNRLPSTQTPDGPRTADGHLGQGAEVLWLEADEVPLQWQFVDSILEAELPGPSDEIESARALRAELAHLRDCHECRQRSMALLGSLQMVFSAHTSEADSTQGLNLAGELRTRHIAAAIMTHSKERPTSELTSPTPAEKSRLSFLRRIVFWPKVAEEPKGRLLQQAGSAGRGPSSFGLSFSSRAAISYTVAIVAAAAIFVGQFGYRRHTTTFGAASQQVPTTSQVATDSDNASPTTTGGALSAGVASAVESLPISQGATFPTSALDQPDKPAAPLPKVSPAVPVVASPAADRPAAVTAAEEASAPSESASVITANTFATAIAAEPSPSSPGGPTNSAPKSVPNSGTAKHVATKKASSEEAVAQGAPATSIQTTTAPAGSQLQAPDASQKPAGAAAPAPEGAIVPTTASPATTRGSGLTSTTPLADMGRFTSISELKSALAGVGGAGNPPSAARSAIPAVAPTQAAANQTAPNLSVTSQIGATISPASVPDGAWDACVSLRNPTARYLAEATVEGSSGTTKRYLVVILPGGSPRLIDPVSCQEI